MRMIFIKLVGNLFNVISFVSVGFAAERAIHLFTRPRKKRLNEEQRDFLNTAFKEELMLDKIHIMTYRWLGQKDTILLLHGWESNASRWKKIIQNLNKKGHGVIAIDAPGHGYSGSKTFNAVLYADCINVVVKRFKPTILIAHSVGGMAAGIFINKYQVTSINKLVLLGAPSEFKDVFKRYTDMMGYNKRILKKTRTLIMERFGREPEEFSTSKYLQSVDSKGLIIHDEDDDVIPYNDALTIKDSYKNSLLITTKGLGHSLTDDSVSQHIYEFIEA
ncbi:Serine aminopeptidase, S33 [Flavobacteriaceae bacterium MAR_2010_188]|nr:Serine aminopeptidase, S33 [Flavobacteriaceae bacterium MAR_2010_188]